MSKGFYVGTVAAAFGTNLLAGTVNSILTLAFRSSLPGYGDPFNQPILAIAFSPLLTALYWIVGIYGSVVSLIFWYKAWASIQDGHARMTPGKAIGFMFIPFFNIYWFFQVYFGFRTDFSAYIDRYNLPVKKLSHGLFVTMWLAAPAALLLSFIHPLLSVLAAYVPYVVQLVIVSKICDGVNGIRAYGKPAT
jgi:hypothetical protein